MKKYKIAKQTRDAEWNWTNVEKKNIKHNLLNRFYNK